MNTHMTPFKMGLTPKQRANLGDAEKTTFVPIDWSAILDNTGYTPLTPASVRAYLQAVIERCNQHFALVIHGSRTGSVQVTRRSRATDADDIMYLSTWRCRTLFNRKLQCRWREGTHSKHIFRNVIDLWMSSTSRREITAPPAKRRVDRAAAPIRAWLAKHATMPSECSLIDWNGLNARNKLTTDFLSNVDRPADWPAKRFWTEVYRLLPASKPRRGHRLRRCGVDVVYIPSQGDVVDMLREFVPEGCCRF